MQDFKPGTELQHSDRVLLQRAGVEVTVLGPRDEADYGRGWWAQSDDGQSWRLYSDDSYLVIGRDES